jgi:predicted esterase
MWGWLLLNHTWEHFSNAYVDRLELSPSTTTLSRYEMASWFDIISLSDPRPGDVVKGLDESKTIIDDMIADQIGKGVAADRIVVSGFSQG